MSFRSSWVCKFSFRINTGKGSVRRCHCMELSIVAAPKDLFFGIRLFPGVVNYSWKAIVIDYDFGRQYLW